MVDEYPMRDGSGVGRALQRGRRAGVASAPTHHHNTAHLYADEKISMKMKKV